MKEINVFIDGASRGNPGPSGIGIVIENKEGVVLKEYKKYLGSSFTNNQAEYLALHKALELVKQISRENIHIFSDSELLIRQLKGIYQVRNEYLRKLFLEVKAMESNFNKVFYDNIRRDKNKHADRLANEAIDEAI